MTSILGKHIKWIRPEKIRKPDLPKQVYSVNHNQRSKTNYTGKVASVIVRLRNGTIRGIYPGTHDKVLEIFKLNPDDVTNLGWLMKDGKEIWR